MEDRIVHILTHGKYSAFNTEDAARPTTLGPSLWRPFEL
jgi:hypothetical protein